MSVRNTLAAALAAAVLLAGCKEQTPIPHTPTIIKIVSGGGQSGDLSSALDSALVVQVLDGATKPVAGVSLTWTQSGGGSLSATIDDQRQRRQVDCQMDARADAPAMQVVTVTSTQIAGVSVSFVANNGATITGTVTAAGGTPFAHVLAFAGARRATLSPLERARTRRFSPEPDRRWVQERRARVWRAPASSAYRSMAVARAGVRADQANGRDAVEAARAQPGRDFAGDGRRAHQASTTRRRSTRSMAALRSGSERRLGRTRRDHLDSRRRAAPACAVLTLSAPFANQPAGERRVSADADCPNDPIYLGAVLVGEHDRSAASLGYHDRQPERHRRVDRHGHSVRSSEHRGESHERRLRLRHRRSSSTTPQNLCDGGNLHARPPVMATDPIQTLPIPTISSSTVLGNCWAHSTLGDHGLWTAGIIGAVGNQRLGFAGVNWTVKIRPIRVLGYHGKWQSASTSRRACCTRRDFPRSGKTAFPFRRHASADHQHEPGRNRREHDSAQDAVTAATNAGSLDRCVGGKRRHRRSVPDVSGGVSERHGRCRGWHGRRARDVFERRDVSSPSPRRAATSASTTTAAAAFWVLVGTFPRASRPYFLRLRNVGLGAIRLRDRCAAARTDADALRRRSFARASSNSRRDQRVRRAATSSDGES